MDEDHSVTVPAGITTAETEIGVQGARLDSSTADYSPDDEDLDEATAAAAAAAEATRDTLAEGLVARLLRPCVDRLDASVQCTRQVVIINNILNSLCKIFLLFFSFLSLD